MPIRFFLVSCFVSASLLTLGGASTVPKIEESWILGWKNYQEITRQLQGTVQFRQRELATKREAFLRFAQNKECRLFEENFPAVKSMGCNLLCYNSNYSFKLTRNQVADEWKLVTVSQRSAAAHQLVKEVDINFNTLEMAIQAGGLTLNELFALPDLVVKSIAATSDHGGTIKVTFTNHHPVKNTREYLSLQEGELWLTNDEYRVVKCSRTRHEASAGKAIEVTEFLYDMDGSLRPMPKTCKRIAGATFESDPWTETSYDFNLQLPSRLPENSEFYLPYFQISEPDEVRQPHFAKWAVAIVVIVALALSFWINRRWNRS